MSGTHCPDENVEEVRIAFGSRGKQAVEQECDGQNPWLV